MYHVEYHHSFPLDNSPVYNWHFWVVVDEYGQPYEQANYQLATFINKKAAEEFCEKISQPKVIDYDGRSE